VNEPSASGGGGPPAGLGSGQQRRLLERLAAQPRRPRALAAFDEFFRRQQWLADLHNDSRPAVGQLCGFVPEELVLACGLRPLRLETGYDEAARLGGQRLGSETCSEVRALAGLLESGGGLLERLQLLLLPTSCDAKRGLAEGLDWPCPVELLQVPAAPQQQRSRRLWLGEMERLLGRLSRLGHRPRRRHLLEASALVNRRAELVRRLNRLRRAEYPPLSGADALEVMQAAALADIAWWNEHATALLDELAAHPRQPAAGEAAPVRLLLAGSPILWPDLKIPLAAAASGGQVVIDDLCNLTAWLDRPLVIDEFNRASLIEAAAERVLLSCACPCLIGQAEPAQRLLRLAADWRVQGVVFHQLVSCTPFAMCSSRCASRVSSAGLGWLELHSQFGEEEEAPLRNRLEAFCEMLRDRP